MKKIILQNLPKGSILSNEELKSVVGGVNKEKECICTKTFSDDTETSSVLTGNEIKDLTSCGEACRSSCLGYSDTDGRTCIAYKAQY